MCLLPGEAPVMFHDEQWSVFIYLAGDIQYWQAVKS